MRENTIKEFKAIKEFKTTDTLGQIVAHYPGAGDLIKAIRTITDHYTVPEDACSTYALTYTKLQAFEKNTFEHVHLENNILFKQL